MKYRWATHTPVGYEVWTNLHNLDLFAKIPDRLSQQEPEFISELTKIKGFGFIWAIFVAHICKPKVYPLYDQHVWRAFRNISSKGIDHPTLAPNQWSDFIQYSQFFQDLLQKCNIPYWELDQALWVFGKSIKRNAKQSRFQHCASLPFSVSTDDPFVHSVTLGRSKPFWWFIDEQCNIHIGRSFKNGTINSKLVPAKLINNLFDYLSDPAVFPSREFPLANNVQNLENGSEVPGIGKFLHEKGFNTTESQLASHLATIFYSAGIWSYNGRSKGQLYWFSDDYSEWHKLVKDYCIDSLQNDFA